MKKLIIKITLALCILFIYNCPVYASNNNEITSVIVTPRNTNIKYSTISLSLVNGTAYCNASVTAYSSNTNNVSINLYLQKYNNGWGTVNNWSGSAATYYFNLNKTSSISSGRYRLKATYQAGKETIVKYSSEQTY